MSGLGTPSWERFDASLDISVDAGCHYRWTYEFQHDENLPIPDDPANQCNPASVPPVLASDGLPYFAFRWHYESVPDYFYKATGITHISLDFNPCGHPPQDVFTAPHYDIHTYRVSPEFRTCMLCEPIPGSPICQPSQTTESGQAFFADITQDLPAGYINNPNDAVIQMGGHAWDPTEQPVDAEGWTEPVMVMGTYNGQNIYYEPMPPLAFVTGSTDKLWEYSIEYENQVTENLAFFSSVSYSAATGKTTFTFIGDSSICRGEFEARRFFDKLRNLFRPIFDFLFSLFGWI